MAALAERGGGGGATFTGTLFRPWLPLSKLVPQSPLRAAELDAASETSMASMRDDTIPTSSLSMDSVFSTWPARSSNMAMDDVAISLGNKVSSMSLTSMASETILD
jgi:hypothetical protein